MNATRMTDILGSAHLSILWLCVVVAALVFVAIVYSIVAFRPADVAKAAVHARNRVRELAWALVPIAIVVAAAAPAVTNFASTQSVGASHVAANGGTP